MLEGLVALSMTHNYHPPLASRNLANPVSTSPLPLSPAPYALAPCPSGPSNPAKAVLPGSPDRAARHRNGPPRSASSPRHSSARAQTRPCSCTTDNTAPQTSVSHTRPPCSRQSSRILPRLGDYNILVSCCCFRWLLGCWRRGRCCSPAEVEPEDRK